MSPSDPLVALSRWVAEGSSDQAALARARQHWLERQAEEEATLVGSIIDLAERGQAITIATTAGGRHTGAVVAVGSDFAILRVHRFGDIVIRHDAIAFLRPFPGDNTPTGDRPLEINLALADALVELSAERPRVQIATGGEELTGELRSAATTSWRSDSTIHAERPCTSPSTSSTISSFCLVDVAVWSSPLAF